MVSAPFAALACSQAATKRVVLNPQGNQPHSIPAAMRLGRLSKGSSLRCKGARRRQVPMPVRDAPEAASKSVDSNFFGPTQ